MMNDDHNMSDRFMSLASSLSLTPTLPPLAIPKLNVQIIKKYLAAVGFEPTTL